MLVKSLDIQQRANAGLPAAAPNDLVRKLEMETLVSGRALMHHTHPTSDITGLPAAVLALLQAEFLDTLTVTWLPSGVQMTASVRLKANGGVKAGSQGLYIDSGVVALRGHTHVAADIADLATAIDTEMRAYLGPSATVEWQVSGTRFIANVQTHAGGGLQVMGDGLEVDFGTGTNQAARGDHTHAQLHNPASAAPSASLTLNLDPTSQVLTAEVKLAPAGGLTLLPSGVAADWGSGHSQVPRGDHTHAGLQVAITAVSTPSLQLSLDANGVLSGVVARDPNPGPNQGLVGLNAAGLYVALGSGSHVAARGDHGHTTATETADGFLSMADKIKLDALSPSGNPFTGPEPLLIVLDGAGTPILTGFYEYVVMPYSGVITGWDLVGNQSGVLTVDVYRGAFTGLPLNAGNSITGANKPTATSALGLVPPRGQRGQLGWPFGAGEVLGFNVDLCSGVRRATLGLRITRV